jgi:hypothetical protein
LVGGTPTTATERLELRQYGRETILINLKVAIPLTTDIRLGQACLIKRRVLSNRRIARRQIISFHSRRKNYVGYHSAT